MNKTHEPLLSVSDLRVHIATSGGQVRAVDGVSFDIGKGQTVALLGESGCGKSITALSIMRLLPEAAHIRGGEVNLGGSELFALTEREMREIRGKRVGIIFQEPQTSLNPVMTIGEQIAEALPKGLGAREVERRVVRLLESVGMADAPRRFAEYPHQLSGGMRQRAMIAMALASEPDLLIADEPTTALDVTIQAQILDLLAEQQKRTGMGMLLITHDLGIVAKMADEVAVMYAGEIVEAASRERLFAQPRHPYTRKLFQSVPTRKKRSERLDVIPGSVPALTRMFGGCRFAERCDWAWEACRQQIPRWLGDAGNGVRCHLYDEQVGHAPPGGRRGGQEGVTRGEGQTQGDHALHVRDLEVYFPIQKGILKRTVGYVKAVDGLSLDIAPGRTLALVGESGSGKTTVGKAILQLIRPRAGRVEFAGRELTQLSGPELRAIRSRIQVIFQDPYASLNPRMQVGAIIDEGMRALAVGSGADERNARIDALLSQVGLGPEVKTRYPHEFSGGQRQRIAIARALAVEPQLIICDEPTSALDVSVQAQILNLLKSLQDALGLSYLFITHNISVVDYLAHDVAIMYLGRVVERGPVQEVLDHPRHPYTQALLSAVPTLEPETQRQIIQLQGDMPSPSAPPSGCHFHPRCSYAMPVCREVYPGVSKVGEAHEAHCHLYDSGEGERTADDGTERVAR
jgi:peptide/nickel transport system ATP-binding protein